MALQNVPEDLRRLLEEHRFDEGVFEGLRARLRQGALGGAANRLRCDVAPPPAGTWASLPGRGSRERAELERSGRRAIEAGKVGAVILNGGMATRFGGVVKGAVPAVGDRSFLDLKLADVRLVGGGRAWALVMSSFATRDATQTLLATLPSPGKLRSFCQGIMLRVTPEGALFLDRDGRPSPATPGHGDVSFALRETGVLREFLEEGGEVLLVSNVDNLAATLSPAIIGAHLSMGCEMTVELVDKDPGDVGGAPAVVGGRVQIIEGFRFPASFDQASIPVFNTNTFIFDARALDRDFPLTWFAVGKSIEGRDAVQFERLAGELSGFLETRYLHVPREGPDGRFLPAKDPEELERRRPAIREVLSDRGIL